jgi:hypothetical protein
MRTIIHTNDLDAPSDWFENRSRLNEDTVYQFDLENGFKPQLKPTEQGFVDFRRNEYIVDFRDQELLLYKKPSDDSKLERLSRIQKIMVDE